MQAARAMFTLGKYTEMIDWWAKVRNDIQDEAIRKCIQGYVAGALFRTGAEEKGRRGCFSGFFGVSSPERICMGYLRELRWIEFIKPYPNGTVKRKTRNPMEKVLKTAARRKAYG